MRHRFDRLCGHESQRGLVRGVHLEESQPLCASPTARRLSCAAAGGGCAFERDGDVERWWYLTKRLTRLLGKTCLDARRPRESCRYARVEILRNHWSGAES